MKKIIKFMLLLIITVVSADVSYANTNLRMGQSSVDENGIYLFLNGDLSTDTSTVVVGQADVLVDSIEKREEYTENLIFVIDLSGSMTSALQTQVKEILSSVMSGRRANQRVMVLGFGESTDVLCDLTTDPIHIQYTLDNLTFDRDASNIYDALNETVNIASSLEKNELNQVIIFTDGVLYTDYGVTQAELYLSASKLGFEIQTVGFYKNNNDSDLNELFALSRITEGVTFSTKDTTTAVIGASIVSRNDDIRAYSVPLMQEWADGSEKAITVTVNGASTVRDLRIPTMVVVEPEPEPIPEPQPEPIPEPEPEPIPEPEPKFQLEKIHYMIMVAIVVVGVIGFLIFKANKRKKERERLELERQQNMFRPPSATEGTELMRDGITDMLMQSGTENSSAVLMQKNNQNFSFTLRGNCVIGRDSGCDWAISHEKSISSRHCNVTRESDGFYIEDLGSTNKTFINEREISGKQKLENDDNVKLGRMEFVFKFM